MGGYILSKEVLWISEGRLASKLQAVKDRSLNKCSVGPETSICPRGKGQAQLPFPREDFSFPRSGLPAKV